MTKPSRPCVLFALMAHLTITTNVFAASQVVVVEDGGVQRDNEAAEAEQGGPTAAGPVGERPDDKDERTGLLWIFPEAYANFEMRHVTLRQMSRDRGLVHVTGGPILLDNKHELVDSPHWELRPTIGSTFLNGKLDSAFTFVFVNDVGSSDLVKHDVVNYTQWNVIDGKFNANSPYLFGPSAFTDLMTGDNGGASFAYSDIGFFGEANYQFPIPTGSFTVRGYLNPTMEVYSPEQSKKNRSTLVRGNDPGQRRGVSSSPLVDTDLPEDAPMAARQKHPLYLAFYGIGGTYKPTSLEHLSLALSFDIIETWKPVYKETVVPGQSETSVKLESHERDAVSFARFTATYEVSKRVTVVNQLRHYTAGIWERGISADNPERTAQVGAVSWENRLCMIVTLF